MNDRLAILRWERNEIPSERKSPIRTGSLIVFEGVDGVGKTTLAEKVANLLTPQIRYVSRRQAAAISSDSGRLMESLAGVLWRSGVGVEMPLQFWVHLQAAWFAAHREKLIRPLCEEGCNVLVDGWIFKHMAGLLLQGYDMPTLRAIFEDRYPPDHVVLLRRSLELLQGLRDSPSSFELGLRARRMIASETSSHEIRTQVGDHLDAFARQLGWTVFDIRSDESPHASAERLALVVQHLIGREAPAPSSDEIGGRSSG